LQNNSVEISAIKMKMASLIVLVRNIKKQKLYFILDALPELQILKRQCPFFPNSSLAWLKNPIISRSTLTKRKKTAKLVKTFSTF
jgi:hypothetical protein